jgi:Ankyrin repeats (3 copies)
MMPYLVSQSNSPSSATKPSTPKKMLADAMMEDAMDDDFLFIDDDDDDDDDDDLNSSDEDTSDDDEEDGHEAHEESESEDSDESLSHEDAEEEATMDEAERLVASLGNLQAGPGMVGVLSAQSLKSLLSLSASANGSADRRPRRRGGAGDNRLQASSSMANLMQMKMALEASQAGQPRIMQQSVSVGHIGQMLSSQAATEDQVDDSVMKPDDYLASLIGGAGQLFSYDSLEGFFLPVKPEFVQAWTNDLTRAVRDHDLAELQRMHHQGLRLQACNQFGESIVHLTVRRGTPEMLRFLIQDAGVCMRVCCDYGRTPLHDAAWSLASSTGGFEKMELLLRESPMQLYITDKRGFTPLSYVPRNKWKECNAFLDRQYSKGRLFRMGAAAPPK